MFKICFSLGGWVTLSVSLWRGQGMSMTEWGRGWISSSWWWDPATVEGPVAAKCRLLTLLWRNRGYKSRPGIRVFETLSSAGFTSFEKTMGAVFSPNSRPWKANDWFLHWKQKYFWKDLCTWMDRCVLQVYACQKSLPCLAVSSDKKCFLFGNDRLLQTCWVWSGQLLAIRSFFFPN